MVNPEKWGSAMGFQGKCFPILLLLLFLANSTTLTDSADNIHDFLGLNDPFFNPNLDSTFTAQEGGVAYLSCEVTTIILTITTSLNLNTTIFILISSNCYQRCSIWITSRCPGFVQRIITSWLWTARPSFQASSFLRTFFTSGKSENQTRASYKLFSSDRRFSSMQRRGKMSDTVTLAIQAIPFSVLLWTVCFKEKNLLLKGKKLPFCPWMEEVLLLSQNVNKISFPKCRKGEKVKIKKDVLQLFPNWLQMQF